METEELHVRIGQVKIGRPGNSLHAILGSCVGIGILIHKREIYGLAHCLLSESANKNFTIGARYVDQAVHSLFSLMKIDEDDTKGVRAILAGGGNMTKPGDTSPAALVGSLNAAFAKKVIRSKRVKIIHEDVGGMHGRKIQIDCSTGAFTVKSIPRLGGS